MSPFVFVCTCVGVCMGIYVHVWVCMDIHAHACMYMQTYAHACACKHDCSWIHVCACIYVHVGVGMCMCTVWVCVHACSRECGCWRLVSGGFLHNPPLHLLKQGLSLNLYLLI